MSLPKIAAQIVFVGGQIVGRAFVEAWKQAGRNMRAGDSAMGSGSGSVGAGAADSVSRQYKMTFDEACNILNVKKEVAKADESALQELLKNYEKMMKMNDKTSHYLQSKIVRARERIEAELPGMSKGGQAAAKEAEAAPPNPSPSSTTQTPPS